MMSSKGLLDEERLASAHQAESFTRQIQRLQGPNIYIPGEKETHMTNTDLKLSVEMSSE